MTRIEDDILEYAEINPGFKTFELLQHLKKRYEPIKTLNTIDNLTKENKLIVRQMPWGKSFVKVYWRC